MRLGQTSVYPEGEELRGAAAMRIKRLPAGFTVPAQPVKASKPPFGADWVHEIKHAGYRIMVHRDGPTVRLYSRNAYGWTARLAAIAAAAELVKAKSFTINCEAVVLGPDGLSRFEGLRGRAAADMAMTGRIRAFCAPTAGLFERPKHFHDSS
jgi:bifunctional non-homologous end joining protein LigD